MSRRRKKNSRLIIVIASVIAACIVCSIVVFIGGRILPGTNTPTPENTSLPVEQIIALTSNVANTQTAIASSPTPFPSFTPVPQLDIIPTATLFIIQTDTPLVLPTQPPPTLKSVVTQPSGACSCSGDTLNCSDFFSHADAQACYDYCISIGRGDIYNLDGNNDGNACESLP